MNPNQAEPNTKFLNQNQAPIATSKPTHIHISADHILYEPRFDALIEAYWGKPVSPNPEAPARDPGASFYLSVLRRSVILGGSSDEAVEQVKLLLPMLEATESDQIREWVTDALLTYRILHHEALTPGLISRVEAAVTEEALPGITARWAKSPTKSWVALCGPRKPSDAALAQAAVLSGGN